ncbi:MAG: transposase [Candidatus Sumerlaeia bacterium]|nr:transposase [Candidatus Sumerlaeia bacterium]
MVVKLRVRSKVYPFTLLVTLGVRSEGSKVLRYFGSESAESKESWQMLVKELKGRGLRLPMIVLSEYGKEVCAGLREEFLDTRHQSWTVHKLRNLLGYVFPNPSAGKGSKN